MSILRADSIPELKESLILTFNLFKDEKLEYYRQEKGRYAYYLEKIKEHGF